MQHFPELNWTDPEAHTARVCVECRVHAPVGLADDHRASFKSSLQDKGDYDQ